MFRLRKPTVPRPAPRPPTRLAVEFLEARCLPTTTGLPWPDGRHLTLSFAPAGTPIAGHRSDPTDPWRLEILRAFQTWAVQANLNIGVVPDGGQPFGAAGRTQGDERFGDIRIGAQRMSSEVLAVTVADPFLAGTLAGDVFFNSARPLSPGDLFAVALHEAGHAFGLGDSSDPNSVMFTHLDNPRATLSGSDIAAVRDLYGARAPDANEGQNGNNTRLWATRIPFPNSGPHHYTGSTPLVVFGDLTTLADVDYFWFEPLNDYTGPVTLRLQTAGLSLLAPRLTVLDKHGAVLGASQSADPLGSVVTVRLAHVNPDERYFFRVERAVSDVFGIGRYGVAVTFDANLTTPPARIDAVLRGAYHEALEDDDLQELFRRPAGIVFNDDRHTDDTFQTAERLRPTTGYAEDTHYETLASIRDPTDLDFYRFEAADVPAGRPNVMTATVVAVGDNGTVPLLALFDRTFNPVAATILANGNGTFTLQAANLTAGANYFLRVSPGTAGDGTGNYFLGIDFGRVTANLPTLVTGTLGSPAVQHTYALYVAQSQLFHLVLTADPAPAPPGTSVRLTIADANGNVVFALSARPGETVSGPGRFLAPGTYTVRFAVQTPDGTSPPLTYRLRGAGTGRPIGPAIDDPLLDPQFVSADDPGLFSYPGDLLSPFAFLIVALAS